MISDTRRTNLHKRRGVQSEFFIAEVANRFFWTTVHAHKQLRTDHCRTKDYHSVSRSIHDLWARPYQSVAEQASERMLDDRVVIFSFRRP